MSKGKQHWDKVFYIHFFGLFVTEYQSIHDTPGKGSVLCEQDHWKKIQTQNMNGVNVSTWA